VRRYLEAGLMRAGVVSPRTEGTPQGGPLSPLLSNILLTDWDRELEARGLAFVRYADDCNIYVGSEAAGCSLMAKLTVWLKEHLKLTVNEAKSAVARPWERKFLGYGLTRVGKLKVAAPSIVRLKDKIREALRRARGRSLAATIRSLNPKLTGWMAYFRLTEPKRALEDLDGWIRRKLRCLLWRQWKRPYARARRLMSRGLEQARAWQSATNGRGPWWNSGASHMHAAFPKAWFDAQGLASLVDTHRRLQRAS
jgi:RNA-directed DNA polymerase